MKSSETIDPALETMKQVDDYLKSDTQEGPIPLDDPPPGAAGTEVVPNDEFLKNIVMQCVTSGLALGAKVGCQSPAMEGLFTEEEWKTSVTSLTVIVIQKRWPDIANQTTPEFMLVFMIGTYLLKNVKPLLGLVHGKSNSNTGGNGDGKNNKDAGVVGPVPEGDSH